MKIKNVKILGDNFRSLAANKLYEFNTSFREDRLSTKIFAGLNGSGKSNFLELFSEIFYYLEIFHLNTVSDEEKKSKNFGFEIEYYLPMVRTTPIVLESNKGIHFDMLIRIVKPLGDIPEFSYMSLDEQEFKRVDEMTEMFLPTKVIAYTSGQNELLSNPYYKLKYHYFKAFEEKKKLKEEEEISENHRLFYLDYNANFSIFIANMLLANEEKLQLVKKELKINELQSFRITINTDELYQKVIPVSDKIGENLSKLKLCSTTWTEKKVGKYNLLILDYFITPATKDAFELHFTNSFKLFTAFYELEIFNLYLVNSKTRSLILNANKTLNISDEMSKPDPSRMVFRIEKVIISKIIEEGKPEKNIYYKSLSDGEHQFNEVIGTVLMMQEEGCLFLMDEPDTHFNPMWRAKMIEMLNNVSAICHDENGKIEKVRKHEIIVTTHSPFVISDSQKEDVYKFSKGDYEKPEIQTYGGSVGMILETIFERDISISDYSNIDLIELKKSIKSLADIQRVKKELLKFGESVEKFDAYSFLQSKEEEFKNNKEE
ncbi:restriction system-associated AAA family ATPase [Flavobacterium sp. XS2P12]|uniref:restriction system-associated AAA family ATPase n=1 Tax=Flavobacterium melibiosi TaxID=3398734 RepID=UPI003A874CF4